MDNTQSTFMEQANAAATQLNRETFNFTADSRFSENIKYCPVKNIHIKGYKRSVTDNEYTNEILYLHTDYGIYHTTAESFVKKFDRLIATYPNKEMDIVLIEKMSTNGNYYIGFTIA